MTWTNRFKLALGLVVVLAIVAVATLLSTQRQAQATSTSATVQAQEYAVGTDYSGTVVEQFVVVGDVVATGDPLFRVQSPSLVQEAGRGLVTVDTASYSVASDGTVTFTSTVDGTVADVTAEEGTFVPGGSQLATIAQDGSLSVQADFLLSPRDYERIEEGADVDLLLPDQKSVHGTVDTVAVTTEEGQAQTSIRVVSPELVGGTWNGLAAPGTPIEATLHLRGDGLLAGAVDEGRQFLRQIGL